MKCLKCGADIYDGVKKCPYCKNLTQEVKEDEKFKNFDFKYTITSDEQMEKIRKIVKATSKSKKKKNGFKSKIKKYFDDRRAEKRAVKRALRRGEDPQRVLKQLEDKEEVNPFLRNTAVVDSEDDSLDTYRRVKKRKSSDEKTNLRNRPQKSSSDRSGLMRLVMVTGAALVGVALVIYLLVLLFSSIFGGNGTSYSYAKDNSLFVVYDGENLTASKNIIDESYIRKMSEMENPQSVDSVIKSEKLVFTAKNGEITYFFENYNPETDCGRLRAIIKGNTEKMITVSEAVHNSVVVGQDGEKLLYLRAYDPEVQTGALHFWEKSLEEAVKISTDIDPGTYKFSKDNSWVLFLQNLNRGEKSGDFYAMNLEEPDSEKQKIDSDVCSIFESDSDGDHRIYGKEYDPADGSFDVYAVDSKGQSKRLGERTDKAPNVQKKNNTVTILGIDDDGKDTTHNLYLVDIDSGKKTKVDSEVSSIKKLSSDEDIIIYEKLYNDEIADYYAFTEGTMPVKVAGNVIVDKDVVKNNPQIAITADGTNVLYISEFDSLKAGGSLVWCVYDDGEITSEKLIAEDVHSCYNTKDGVFVFTKNYSQTKNYFDVYALKNGKELLLKEEVHPEMFAVDKTGNNIYYISNYNVEGHFGILERMNFEAVSTELAKEVYDFDVTGSGDVMFKKNLNSNKNTFDLYMVECDGVEAVELNTSVGEIIQP